MTISSLSTLILGAKKTSGDWRDHHSVLQDCCRILCGLNIAFITINKIQSVLGHIVRFPVYMDTFGNQRRATRERDHQILIYHTWLSCCCWWSSFPITHPPPPPQFNDDMISPVSLYLSTYLVSSPSIHTWFLIKLLFMRPKMVCSAKNVPLNLWPYVRKIQKVAALSPSFTSRLVVFVVAFHWMDRGTWWGPKNYYTFAPQYK